MTVGNEPEASNVELIKRQVLLVYLVVTLNIADTGQSELIMSVVWISFEIMRPAGRVDETGYRGHTSCLMK